MLSILFRVSCVVLLVGQMFAYLDAKVIPQVPNVADNVFGDVSLADAAQESEAECQESKRYTVSYPDLPPRQLLLPLLKTRDLGVKKIKDYCFVRLATKSGSWKLSGLKIWRYDEVSGLLALDGVKFHFAWCKDHPAPVRLRREDTTPPPPRPCEESGSGEEE